MINWIALGLSLFSGGTIGGIKIGDVVNGVKFIGDVFGFNSSEKKNVLEDPNFGSNLLGNLFNTLSSSSYLGGIDLGDIFTGMIGSSSSGSSGRGSSDRFNLGDIFAGLGNNSSFDSINLGSLFDTLTGSGSSGAANNSSLGDLFDSLGSLFGNINLGDLFGGLDDNYYYVFEPMPVTNLFRNLSGDDILSRPASKFDQVDLLDGLGTFLNVLGEADMLKGTGVQDVTRGNVINDALVGRANNDLLIGLSGNDRLAGAGGRDILNGGEGDDRLIGGDGDDILVGGEGKDMLIGGRGRDVLMGNGGADTMIGGRGSDLFVLDYKYGMRDSIDVIRDFKRGIDLIGLPKEIQFDRLKLTQKGDDTLISLGRTSLAVLENVDADRLGESDFLSMVQQSNS
jgi:Ca2+-binding RTX toxin-like protein